MSVTHLGRSSIAAVLATAAMFLCVERAHAETRPPLSVVVVLDTSGSMAQRGHDPDEISKFAVEVLARFLDDDDRLAVVPLGGSTQVLPLTRVADVRDGLADALAAIRYDGGTPCAERLDTARDLLRRAAPPFGTASIVLLTDGVCHEGAGDKAAQDGRARTTAQALRDDGIPIFGVPLGADADEAFVRELSSGAELEWTVARVEEARQLPALFASISAALRRTEARAVPLARGKQDLVLDPYLRSVTVLATVDGGRLALRDLTDPAGERAAVSPVEGHYPRSERRARRAAGYSLLKLQAPDPGTWSVRVDAPAQPTAVVVYDYDLRAALELLGPDPLLPGSTVTARATLRTPDGQPVEAGFLEGAAASLQARGPGDGTWRDVGEMAWDGVAWFTLAQPVPDLGRYRFRARVTRGRSLDLRAYADATTAPGIALVAPAGPCLPDGEPATFVAAVTAAPGTALAPAAAEGMDVRLWVKGPSDAEAQPVARLAWDAGRQAFAGDWAAPGPGEYAVEARLQGGPGVAATSAAREARVVRARVALDAAPVELASLKAGGEVAGVSPWVTAEVSRELTVAVDTSAVSLPDGVTLEATAPDLAPGSAGPVELVLRADAGSPGGAVAGPVRVAVSGPCLPGAGLAFEVPVRATVVPLTAWERFVAFWRAHPLVVIGLALLLLLVLYALLVLLCMRRTHAFDENLAVALGEGLQKFTLPKPVHEYSGTRRRYLVPLRCRHARLYWNVHDDDFGDTRDPTWYLEATRDGGARLVLPDGAAAEAAPEATRRLAALETPCDLHSGVIYKVGDVTFKLL